MHHPYKDKEAISEGKTKRANTVKFDGAKQEVNTMKSHDEPIPKKKKGKNHKKKPKSDQANADPSEDDFICGIDRLNLVKPEHDSENYSERLLAQRREAHMEDK